MKNRKPSIKELKIQAVSTRKDILTMLEQAGSVRGVRVDLADPAKRVRLRDVDGTRVTKATVLR